MTDRHGICPKCEKETDLHEVYDMSWSGFQGHEFEQKYWCENCLDAAGERAEQFINSSYQVQDQWHREFK
jgi:hypothetical protein